jgi:hypothetical protein
VTDPKVEHFLDLWATGKDLYRAEHFFWILGDSVQKSREGLLRHLLYSALLSLPANRSDLTKQVCGSRRLSGSGQRAWTYEEMFDTLARLVSCSNAKFFLLVDALDECDPQDIHGQLAEEIMKISQLPNVKLCVSCRPWSAFVTKFPANRTIHLDHLTRRDMELYIACRLGTAGGENQLCHEFIDQPRTKRITDFVADFAHAAEGVFLWTELAVKALSSELRKGAGFGQLQRVLTEFPVGLDQYSQQLIFDRITKTRQNTSDTAAVLTLALKIAKQREKDSWRYDHVPDPYSFLNFWLLRTGKLTAGFSWTDHDGKRYSRQDMQQMARWTTNYLQETCKDLLVVVEGSASEQSTQRVEFLHRTVFDFLCDDRVRLVIEQHSPDHFNDPKFLADLGKLRCVCLLHMTLATCQSRESIFGSVVRWSQPLPHSDRAWLLKCEALMIDEYQEMQEACRRSQDIHRMTWVEDYTYLGLSKYLSTLIVSRPDLTVLRSYFVHFRYDDVLVDFLSGLINSIFAEPHIETFDKTVPYSLRTFAWDFLVSMGNGFTSSYGSSPKYLHSSSVYMLGDRRTRLLDLLLKCGSDVNRQRLMHSGRLVVMKGCEGTVWQNWLRTACLRLELHDEESEKLQDPTRFSGISQHVKNFISDMVTVLLWHGADPACSICISRHHDGGACHLLSLESVLEKLAPRSRLYQLQHMRVGYAGRFNRRDTRQIHMLRAMRSASASGDTSLGRASRASREDPESILRGFVLKMRCDFRGCLSVNHTYVAALCLDCTGGYYLCNRGFGKSYPGFATQNEVTKLLVHECLPSDKPHEYISFGNEVPDGGQQRYGFERSISLLENWYARNVNGADAALD